MMLTHPLSFKTTNHLLFSENVSELLDPIKLDKIINLIF